MFSTLRGFLDRHKKKFIFTGALIGGTALAISYAQRRLREWQEKETKSFLDMSRKKCHYGSIERNCNQTILNLVTSVSESIMKTLDTQEILNQLSSNPSNKAELWEELKVLTFARATAVIYAFTILVVTSRIQLSIMGGYGYKDTMEDSDLLNNDLRLKYMSMCNYFIAEGIEKLCKQIYSTVKTIISPIRLKQKLTLKDTEQLFWSIQASHCTDNDDPLKHMVSYVVIDYKNDKDRMLKVIVNETMDLLESDEVTTLCISSVSRSFSLFFDNIAEYFTPLSSSTNGKITNGDANDAEAANGFTDKSHLNSFVNINNVELPFIKLIPIINGLMSQPTENGLSGAQLSIIEQLILNDKLKVLGANIYEVFSN
ncbi:peroxisomal biogenesis factor 3 [Arctopsyche grandis]|uniref:peroxisomal biogenesis factor 3 n=1 Tax=Arctopsyche grandis TaxID=121162 RepID=UPI00406D9AE5